MSELNNYEAGSIRKPDDEQRSWGCEHANKRLEKPETVDNGNMPDLPPYSLLAYRNIKHLYTQVGTGGSLPAAKLVMSLGFQMRASIQDLMSELREQGRDYDLLLKGGFEGEKGRWELFVNGELFALIDRDYGFDSFDTSGTQFKSNIVRLINRAERRFLISPLSVKERKELDSRIAAEPLEWGRLHPDEKHGVGLGTESLNKIVRKPQADGSLVSEYEELNNFIIGRYCFRSKKIKQHLIQQEIDAWTQALIVFTTVSPLTVKKFIFSKLIEEERRKIQYLTSQIKDLRSNEKDPADENSRDRSVNEVRSNGPNTSADVCVTNRQSSTDEHVELTNKITESKKSIEVFSSYLQLIDGVMQKFFVDCILCTIYQHDEYHEPDGTLGVGSEFNKLGILKITTEVAVPDTADLANQSLKPSLGISTGVKSTFVQIKPWDITQTIPEFEYNEDYDAVDEEAISFTFEDGCLKPSDGRTFSEIVDEISDEMNCNDFEAYDDTGLVGYIALGETLSFFMNDNLGDFVFGPEDEYLASLHSLFVGIFKQGDILLLDFEPFYRKREGIVLKPAYKGTSDGEDYVVSEMVLTKVGTRWACGDLAGRFFFGGIDPLGFYFNSYSGVKESKSHEPLYDMVALEALIGTFLHEARNEPGEKERIFSSKEDAAKEVEFYMLEAVHLKLAEDSSLADRIIRAFDSSPQFGLTDEELIEICGLEI